MNPLKNLLDFLNHLAQAEVGFVLQSDPETVMVLVRTRTGIHEVAFFPDGAIQVQSFEGEEEGDTVTFEELMSNKDFSAH